MHAKSDIGQRAGNKSKPLVTIRQDKFAWMQIWCTVGCGEHRMRLAVPLAKDKPGAALLEKTGEGALANPQSSRRATPRPCVASKIKSAVPGGRSS